MSNGLQPDFRSRISVLDHLKSGQPWSSSQPSPFDCQAVQQNLAAGIKQKAVEDYSKVGLPKRRLEFNDQRPVPSWKISDKVRPESSSSAFFIPVKQNLSTMSFKTKQAAAGQAPNVHLKSDPVFSKLHFYKPEHITGCTKFILPQRAHSDDIMELISNCK